MLQQFTALRSRAWIIFQTELPEAVTDKHQEGGNERSEPRDVADLFSKQVTRRVERCKSVWDHPREQDGNGPGVDRKRILGKQMIIKDEAGDRDRIHDPEGGDAWDEIQRDEDKSAADDRDYKHQEFEESPFDAKVNWSLDYERHTDDKIPNAILTEAICQ